MAKLYPYYVHSNISNFQQMGGQMTADVNANAAVKGLKKFLNEKIQTLLSIENSFYAAIGLTGTGDNGYKSFLAQIKKAKLKQADDEATILIVLSDYITHQDENGAFYNGLVDACLTAYNQLITQKVDPSPAVQQAVKQEMEKRLLAYAQTKWTDPTTRVRAEGVIKDIMSNTQVSFTAIDYSNLRGGIGEILYTPEIGNILADAIDPNVSFSNIGQKLNAKGQQLSSDAILTITNNLNQIVTEVTWQLKNYNLAAKSNAKTIRFTGLETTKWPGLKDEIVEEGLLSSDQFDWMTYALVNYTWFNKAGSVDSWWTIHRQGRKVSFAKNSKNNRASDEVMGILDQAKRVLGVLALRKIVQGLDDISFTDGGTGGSITLSTINGANKIVNIPPVYWNISNTYFFPTRWILRSVIKWLDQLETQVFSPMYLQVTLGKPVYSTPANFYNAKRSAVGHFIKGGDYSNVGLRGVGDAQGAAIANSMRVNQKIAIIKNQINQILSGKWVM